MFTYPATELFNADGERRVVWSNEEYADAMGSGWSETKPEPKAKPAKKAKESEAA